MPTGYTAGILDGEIKDFKRFAKLCMRNFGATIHMRDHSLNDEYIPRTPSDYHAKAIKEANRLIDDSKNLSDEEIVSLRKAELLKSREYHLNAIAKQRADTETLNRFLEEAMNYVPPTDEHKGIKNFMIEQINSTIDFDCNTGYHTKELAVIEKELGTLAPESIRISMQSEADKDLLYHQGEYDKEIKHCQKSNEWVQRFIDSL